MKNLEKAEDFNVESGLFAVKFTAEWCGPCKKQQPNIDKMEEEFPNVQFLSIDTDNFTQITRDYGVKSLPSLFLIKDGHVVKQIVGITLIAGLRTAFTEFVK